MASTHHTIDYIELGSTDLAATCAFFESVFGWQLTAYGPAYAGIVSADGTGEVGGIDASTPPRSGGPLVLIFSDDLDATLAAVRTAGGTIDVQPYAFPGGRRFHFTDPTGNALGVWATS
ncbi:VOC family protein [Aeromicrobium sp. CF3.5]|uniref:VOC family protein n=1 Tax=Aeromicrobium sp. CF3.5 TaxID=3373078 RepID=UPI003EE46E56